MRDIDPTGTVKPAGQARTDRVPFNEQLAGQPRYTSRVPLRLTVLSEQPTSTALVFARHKCPEGLSATVLLVVRSS